LPTITQTKLERLSQIFFSLFNSMMRELLFKAPKIIVKAIFQPYSHIMDIHENTKDW